MARAVFGRNNYYMRVGDQLAQMLQDWNSSSGDKRTIEYPSLVTIFQFSEGLSDFQAVEAVRTRLDWKYALHLPLNYPQIPHARLCEERQRILHDSTCQASFTYLLDCIERLGVIFIVQQADRAKHVIETVCTLSRMELVVKAICMAIETLAADHPDWLRQIATPGWYTRYGPEGIIWRLPVSIADQEAITLSVGKDTRQLIEALTELGASDDVCSDEIQRLDRTWRQQFSQDSNSGMCYLPHCSYCGAQYRCL